VNAKHTYSNSFGKQFCWLIGLAAFVTVATQVSANDNEQHLMEREIERARITQYIKDQHYLVNSDTERSNASIIEQIGNQNNASVMQSYSASFQTGNYAFIRQEGNQNTAAISQWGGNNSASIWQKGNHHNASINQQNDSFSLDFNADIRQFGNSSDVHITQSGGDPRSISIEHHAYSANALPVTVETH
jgi:minor curlin subunit